MKQKIQLLPDGILIFPGPKDKRVCLYDIVFVKGNDYCIQLYLKNGRRLTKVVSLRSLWVLLPYELFRFPHKSYMVNLSLVSECSPYERRNYQLSFTIIKEHAYASERRAPVFITQWEAYKKAQKLKVL